MARLAIGHVAGASGDDGRLRVTCLGDGPANLLAASTVWIARAEDDRFPRRHPVKGSEQVRSGEVSLALLGLRTRADAQAYKGRLVLMDEADLQPPGEDEFYWYELVGFDVVSQDGAAIGSVSELWQTGAHDLLVVVSPAGEQHLIPTAREFVTEIDREARRIVVALIPGLLESQ